MAKVEIKEEEQEKETEVLENAEEEKENMIQDDPEDVGPAGEEAGEEADSADTEETEEEEDTEPEEEEPEEEPSENADEADSKAAEGEGAGEKKKGFKWKKEKKDKRDEKIEELTDRVKRQMAEFENFRKRTEKEKASMYEMGAKSVIEKMLPVIDNFERGLSTVPEEEEDSPFTEGMRKIYKQLMTELENMGVKPIECIGKEFDPNYHNAVMQVESEEYESGIVAQEMLKGYTYRDSVVRHSMVAVVS
ncbi:MAG: nucleotide exchange factor GrpE [Lachnospiraceae bacterium]|nr:nucleotide exchange factor GrpE [Lachnospiraceae bacterium]